MRVSREIDVDGKPVAARDAARRMHDHRVAAGIAFGIKRPLQTQRPLVPAMREHRARVLPREAEFEAAVPFVGGFERCVGCVVHECEA